MSYLLIGEAPNAATDRRPDLWLLPDSSGARHSANLLRGYCGLSHGDYRRVFAFRDNVLHRAPPRNRMGKGYSFPKAEARTCAYERLDAHSAELKDGTIAGIVVLGKRAASAFDWHGGVGGSALKAPPDFFEWASVGERPNLERDPFRRDWFSAVVIPHPSGFNRWWNDPANERRARRFLASLSPLA